MDSFGVIKLPPAARQLILQLNELFVESVGPVGRDLANDVLARWASEGKFGPAAIRRYVQALSEHIENPAERSFFLQKVEKLLLQ